MEFQKNYLLLKKIENNEVLALASLIKNGPELIVKIKVIDGNDNGITIIFYDQDKLIKSTQELNFNLPFISENDLSIVIKKDDVIIAFGGQNALLEKLKKQDASYLFYDNGEDIDALIDQALLLNQPKLYPSFMFSPIKNLVLMPLVKRPRAAYFSKYKLLIYNICKNCPRDKVLSILFENSVWARAKTKYGHIVVGVIFKNGKPGFVGFGYPTINGARNRDLDKKFGPTAFTRIPGSQSFGYYLSIKLASTGKTLQIFKKN